MAIQEALRWRRDSGWGNVGDANSVQPVISGRTWHAAPQSRFPGATMGGRHLDDRHEQGRGRANWSAVAAVVEPPRVSASGRLAEAAAESQSPKTASQSPPNLPVLHGIWRPSMPATRGGRIESITPPGELKS